MATVIKPALILSLLALLIYMALMPLMQQQADQIGSSFPDTSHATLKHGLDAVEGRKCSDGRSHFEFYNPTTHRKANVCDLGGVWGVHVLDEWGNEITSFVKNKMRTFEQVSKYMKNSGYQPLH